MQKVHELQTMLFLIYGIYKLVLPFFLGVWNNPISENLEHLSYLKIISWRQLSILMSIVLEATGEVSNYIHNVIHSFLLKELNDTSRESFKCATLLRPSQYRREAKDKTVDNYRYQLQDIMRCKACILANRVRGYFRLC